MNEERKAEVRFGYGVLRDEAEDWRDFREWLKKGDGAGEDPALGIMIQRVEDLRASAESKATDSFCQLHPWAKGVLKRGN